MAAAATYKSFEASSSSRLGSYSANMSYFPSASLFKNQKIHVHFTTWPIHTFSGTLVANVHTSVPMWDMYMHIGAHVITHTRYKHTSESSPILQPQKKSWWMDVVTFMLTREGRAGTKSMFVLDEILRWWTKLYLSYLYLWSLQL